MGAVKIPDWAESATKVILDKVKVKDLHTFMHCCRVGREARLLAEAIGMGQYEQDLLEYSGLFHDVGKALIPDDVLLKPGRLTKEEFDVMKSHPLKSAELLQPLATDPFFRFILPGVRCHHERFDGKGYPYGLEGENIPLAARIIAVVDTVDAMANSRPYRKGLPEEVIHQELLDCSGSQFDGQIVKIYLESQGLFVERRKEQDTQIVDGLIQAA